MKRKLLALCMALTLSVGAFAGCTTEDDVVASDALPQERLVDGVNVGGMMTMVVRAEPISLNPNGIYDPNFGIMAHNIFNRLVKMNARQQVVLDLATGYQVSSDGLEYTFFLHENVYFHDGVRMTSDDVRFTFEEILRQEGQASFALSSIDSIETPDDYTVVFRTSYVDASFLHNLAFQGTHILPRHIYEGQDWLGADAMQYPVGTGPFMWGEWERGVRIVANRNPNFYRGPELPYLDGIIWGFNSDPTTATHAFVAGQFDVLAVFTSAFYNQLRNDPNIDMQVNIFPSRFMVAFNMTEAPFDDINMRMAVSYALNNDELMAIALREVGLEARHFLSPLFDWAVNDNVTLPGFDLDLAREYMAAAGHESLSITVDTPSHAPFPYLAEVFRSQMAALNIDVSINILEWASFDERVIQNHNFQIAITSDFQGPEVSAIAQSIATDGFLNFTGFYNPEIDELLEAALQVVTFEDRARYYHRVQEIMREHMPFYIISEWVGYYPHWAFVRNHPGSPDAVERTGWAEFTYVWFDR